MSKNNPTLRKTSKATTGILELIVVTVAVGAVVALAIVLYKPLTKLAYNQKDTYKVGVAEGNSSDGKLAYVISALDCDGIKFEDDCKVVVKDRATGEEVGTKLVSHENLRISSGSKIIIGASDPEAPSKTTTVVLVGGDSDALKKEMSKLILNDGDQLSIVRVGSVLEKQACVVGVDAVVKPFKISVTTEEGMFDNKFILSVDDSEGISSDGATGIWTVTPMRIMSLVKNVESPKACFDIDLGLAGLREVDKIIARSQDGDEVRVLFESDINAFALNDKVNSKYNLSDVALRLYESNPTFSHWSSKTVKDKDGNESVVSSRVYYQYRDIVLKKWKQSAQFSARACGVSPSRKSVSVIINHVGIQEPAQYEAKTEVLKWYFSGCSPSQL